MNRTAIFAGIVALVLGSSIDSEATAQRLGHGGFGGGKFSSGGSFGGGFGGTRISTVWDLYLKGDIPVPPYFALHPPVYYSYPVPRPYGYSPFAYPPSVKTPEILGDSTPAMVENPYFPSSNKKSAEPSDRLTHRSTPRPLVIINPYVKQSTQFAAFEQ